MGKRRPKNLLTEAELDLMLVLWSRGEGSVRDVLAGLPNKRPMAYTTAATFLRILENKAYVSSRKEGKAHVYTPCISKDDYESRTLGHVVGRLFDDSPASLVACLIQDEKLTDGEIEEIRRLLESKRG